MTTRSYLEPKEPQEADGKMTRRTFLGYSWLATLGLMATSSAYALFVFLKPLLEGAFGGKINIGLPEFFTEKPGEITTVNDARTYISYVDEDEGLLPMWQRCTHLGCTVPWIEEEEKFHCPCHGSVYDKKGEVLGGPAPRPLDLFPMEYNEKGELIVDTGNVIERDGYDKSQLTEVS